MSTEQKHHLQEFVEVNNTSWYDHVKIILSFQLAKSITLSIIISPQYNEGILE
jgi:hypothetical protein